MYADAQEAKRRKSDAKLEAAVAAWPDRAAELTDADGFVDKGKIVEYLCTFEVSGRPQDFADACLGAPRERTTANGKTQQLGWYVRPGEAGAPSPSADPPVNGAVAGIGDGNVDADRADVRRSRYPDIY